MKNIIATLNQLEQQLAQLNYEELSAIERDIVLEKMRSIYEKVLTAEVVTPEEKKVVLEAPNIVVPIVDVPVEEPIEESVIELIEELIDEVEQLPEEEEEESVEEIEETIEENVAIDPENEVVEAVEEPTEEPAEELIDETFEEPVVPQSKIDHKVVLSLYDDEDEEPEGEVVKEPEMIVGEPEEEAPVIDFVIEGPAEEEVAESVEEEVVEEEDSASVQEAPQTVVLADVLGGEQQTIADTMAATQSPDVATIVAATTTSLMKSVSINDKILLTRDLFAGNSALYEQAMEVLDSYESLDEAMLFIYDNFDWNPNSEGAKLLVDLLMRKLL
jgi:hypothetical protein